MILYMYIYICVISIPLHHHFVWLNPYMFGLKSVVQVYVSYALQFVLVPWCSAGWGR